MRRNFTLAGLVGMAMIMGACAQFETQHESLTPTAPSALAGGSSNGALVGIWTPEIGVQAPSPSSCGNFQWEITSQSDTAVQGNFSAECGGGVSISATVSGVLNNPTTVSIAITGTGIVNGFGCPFTLNGVGTIFDDNHAITIPYTGTTCFGPVSGTETVKRPRPAPPAPPPSEAPPPGQNPFHVGGGPLSEARVQQVVDNTGQEFSYLLAPISNTDEKAGRAEELLLRMIWHLHAAGYDSASRQRNPSGAISKDKFTVRLDDGQWHTYDVMTNFDIANVDTRVIFFPISGGNPVAEGGIPD